MGGQACVLYGAAEFSRDTDLAILAEAANLCRLQLALDELQAVRIAVPPFEKKYLDQGLAVHFRCRHPDADGQRLDIMAQMRGVDRFTDLWQRRTTFEHQGDEFNLMALPDLVQAKKTQRDKDWPMIVRLVEANYFSNRTSPTNEQIDFWLGELRTPSLLIEVAQQYPEQCEARLKMRPLLQIALDQEESRLTQALHAEERLERQADRDYWAPRMATLEALRAAARNNRI